VSTGAPTAATGPSDGTARRANGSQPPLPRYGQASLADLTPSLMHALGVRSLPNTLEVEPLAGVCVLLVDGLGWQGLRSHPDAAPFLSTAAEGGTDRVLTAGFPATTTASLSSLGTGLPPGEHGLVGYVVAIPGFDRGLSLLRWELYGSGPHVDLRQTLPPERFQPSRTAFEIASTDGVTVSLVGAPHLERSPLSRAVLRGGRYHRIHSMGDLVSTVVRRLSGHERSFVYAYTPTLDTTGHVRGCGSEAWALELANLDHVARAIADRLPAGRALVVTGDHGMVDVQPDDRLDLKDHPALAAGVRLLCGEGRARHVHTEPGATPDVLAAWTEVLGDRAWVTTGAGAIADGWFGPRVADHVLPRIGDVVAAARAPVGIFQREVDALQGGLVGHHGSMTPAEQLVPFLLFRA
jgi:hypothetical protein